MPADAYILAFGASSAVAILGACSYERRHALCAPRLLDTIGDASYSIYLVHLPLLSVFAKALFASGLAASLPQPISLVLMLGALVAAGMIFSKFVEMPLMKAFGKLRHRPSISDTDVPSPGQS